MKDKYLEKIVEQLKLCEDLALLDFIFQLLKKQAEQT